MHGDGSGEINSLEILPGETPSRYELLSMVRKHSRSLGKTDIEEEEDSDVEMDSRFWHEMLDLYFILSRESRGRQDDDLVFFVRNMKLHGYGFNDNIQEVPPYFVRRWAPKLEKVIGENSAEVDWRRSFYLNLIAHTSFKVTVAICSIQALRRHQNGADTSLSPVYKVVKTVYASPSRVDFQLDSRKILTESDHCFCVLLDAHDGAAFPSERVTNDGTSSNASAPRMSTDSGSSKHSKLTLFSGFVSYQMVREAYDAGKSRFGSLLSIGHGPAKPDRLYMRGPGGRGEVEVAVSGVAENIASTKDLDNEGGWVLVEGRNKKDQNQQDSGPPSPLQISKRGFGVGLGTIVRKAASAASVAAKHAYAAAAAARKADEDMLPLKCCLMSISLPWEYIAHDLLFKGSPPVNL